jgi:hypothetical protein
MTRTTISIVKLWREGISIARRATNNTKLLGRATSAIEKATNITRRATNTVKKTEITWQQE